MKRRAFLFFLIWAASLGAIAAQEKEKKKKEPEAPKNWVYVTSGPTEVRPRASRRGKSVVRLHRGALLPSFEVKSKGNDSWTRVTVVDPAQLTAQRGWVESRSVETRPADQFPRDAEILKLLGGAYLDDTVAAQTAMARFVLHQPGRDAALVCFIGSLLLAQARLQVFWRAEAKWTVGPYLEFPSTDIGSGIKRVEVRDLLGDGNDCLITREPFSRGLENRGEYVVIRRLEGNALVMMWRAPAELINLSSFPPRLAILSPPEKNIGAPGTVTKGEVDFQPRGGMSEPHWKGKVEFRVLGREAPLETVKIEKVCAWDGSKFAPLE